MKTVPGAAEGLRFRVDLRGGRGTVHAKKQRRSLISGARANRHELRAHTLLLNHFPVIGSIIGFGLFLISLFRKNDDLRRGSLIIFAPWL